MSPAQRGAARTQTLPSWAAWLVCLGLLAAASPACGSRETAKISAKSQPDTSDHGTTKDVRGDQGATLAQKDAGAPDARAGRTDVAERAIMDVVIMDAADGGHDILPGPSDVLGDGAETGAGTNDTDGGAISLGDTDAGPDPDVYGDDDLPPPPSLSEVCGTDGVGPGPKVGDPCTTQGERRCVDLKIKLLPIGMLPIVHMSFCGRPYFVACGKNAQGKLVWQPPQTCAGPGVSPKSITYPKYRCNTGSNVLYHKVCRPGASGTAHFCCPRIAETNPVHPEDYGRVLCAGTAGYYRAASYNQLSIDERSGVNKGTMTHLEACSGEVHDCVYWLPISSLPKERLWCVDPKKPPVKDQYGQFKPPKAEWLKPLCIQVSDTKVRFAKTCKESGYWDAPGPGGP